MTASACQVPGAYLVRDEAEPVPYGKTAVDASIIVHHYSFGWLCTACQPSLGTTRPECEHVEAAKIAARS